MAGYASSSAQDQTLKYDVVVDPNLETSHGKLVRYTGHGKRVLDLGCSTGGVARALSAWDCKVWGVEIDADAAKLAEPACERVVVSDLDSLDLEAEFAGNRFDVVLAGDVLEHLLDPARVLRQARALLDDGGYLVASVPNMAHGAVRLALLHGELPPSDTGLLDHTHVQFLTRKSFTYLLDAAGFTVAYMDGTVARIRETEVAFPDDQLTATVIGELESQRDATIYQFVTIAFPDSDVGLASIPALVSKLSIDLELARQNATQWDKRALSAELQVELQRAEIEHVAKDVKNQVSAGLAPLRQQLLVSHDQLMHRDHDVKRVVNLYEQHTHALRESEEDRKRLHTEIVRSHAESAALLSQLQALQNSRTWRVTTKLAALAHGRLPRSKA